MNNLNTPDGTRRQIVDVALGRLEAGPDILRLIYGEESPAPEEIKEIMAGVIDGSTPIDEARQKLAALRDDDSVVVETPEQMGVLIIDPMRVRDRRQELQRQVKASLIARNTQELIVEFDRPEFKEAVKQGAKQIALAYISTAASQELKEAERDVACREIETILERQLESPAYLAMLASGQAALEWLTREEFEESSMRKFSGLLADLGIEPDVGLSQLRLAGRAVYDHCERTEQLLSRLTDIAEMEGVEQAASSKNLFMAIREMHPTAGAYREQIQADYAAAMQFSENMASWFSSYGDEGQRAAASIMSMSESVAGNLIATLIEHQTERRTKQIYG